MCLLCRQWQLSISHTNTININNLYKIKEIKESAKTYTNTYKHSKSIQVSNERIGQVENKPHVIIHKPSSNKLMKLNKIMNRNKICLEYLVNIKKKLIKINFYVFFNLLMFSPYIFLLFFKNFFLHFFTYIFFYFFPICFNFFNFLSPLL